MSEKYSLKEIVKESVSLCNSLKFITSQFQKVYKICEFDINKEYKSPDIFYDDTYITKRKYLLSFLWKILYAANRDLCEIDHSIIRKYIVLAIKYSDILFRFNSKEALVFTDDASGISFKKELLNLESEFNVPSVNYPLYEHLDFAIKQYKRKMGPIKLYKDKYTVKIFDKNIYDALISDNFWNLIIDGLTPFKLVSKKDNLKLKLKYDSYIKICMANKIPLIFLPSLLLIFFLDNSEIITKKSKFQDKIPSIFLFKKRTLPVNCVYYLSNIISLIKNLQLRLNMSDNTKPLYIKFPVFNYLKIGECFSQQIYCENTDSICKYLKTSSDKSSVTISNTINHNNILNSINYLCKYETFCELTTDTNISSKANISLQLIDKVLKSDGSKSYTYKDFTECFILKIKNINELLTYELLRIDIEYRYLDELLAELYNIDFRYTCAETKTEAIEDFYGLIDLTTDTSYILTKVKFLNEIVENLDSEYCINFLDDINMYEKDNFEIFLKNFCSNKKISYPNVQNRDALLNDAFSTVLDLSVIELEHEFNKFWQYDFSMSYCKKSDIKPNSILKGVYRNSKK